MTGFVSKELDFNGYHAAVFPDRIVLEHPEYGNAIYVIELDHNVLLDEIFADRDVQRRLTPGESDYVYDNYWRPIGERAGTKRELRALAGVNVRKLTHGGKDWKARLVSATSDLAKG